MKLIGKGLFTKCYDLGDNKNVLLESCGPVKECISLGWFPSSSFLPKIERIDYNKYKMKKYKKVSSLKNSLIPSHYEIYKELRKLKQPYCKNTYDLKSAWHKEFSTLKNKKISNLLNECLDSLGNYGTDICFEISPRNVAVNNGKLILLDCFFMSSSAKKERAKKSLRSRTY